MDKPTTPVMVFDALPKDEALGWKFRRLSPDGNYLYFQIGTPANITAQPITHAVIVRLNLKTSILETVAQGVRNSVGMDFHPVTGERCWCLTMLPVRSFGSLRLDETGAISPLHAGLGRCAISSAYKL